MVDLNRSRIASCSNLTQGFQTHLDRRGRSRTRRGNLGFVKTQIEGGERSSSGDSARNDILHRRVPDVKQLPAANTPKDHETFSRGKSTSVTPVRDKVSASHSGQYSMETLD